jgi:hypothetical protein
LIRKEDSFDVRESDCNFFIGFLYVVLRIYIDVRYGLINSFFFNNKNMNEVGSLLDFLGPSVDYTSKFKTFEHILVNKTGPSTGNTPTCTNTSHKVSQFSSTPVPSKSSSSSIRKSRASPTLMRLKYSKFNVNPLSLNHTSRPTSSSPDYSNIKSKVKNIQISSLREKIEAPNGQLKVSLREKVRNELM